MSFGTQFINLLKIATGAATWNSPGCRLPSRSWEQLQGAWRWRSHSGSCTGVSESNGKGFGSPPQNRLLSCWLPAVTQVGVYRAFAFKNAPVKLWFAELMVEI